MNTEQNSFNTALDSGILDDTIQEEIINSIDNDILPSSVIQDGDQLFTEIFTETHKKRKRPNDEHEKLKLPTGPVHVNDWNREEPVHPDIYDFSYRKDVPHNTVPDAKQEIANPLIPFAILKQEHVINKTILNNIDELYMGPHSLFPALLAKCWSMTCPCGLTGYIKINDENKPFSTNFMKNIINDSWLTIAYEMLKHRFLYGFCVIVLKDDPETKDIIPIIFPIELYTLVWKYDIYSAPKYGIRTKWCPTIRYPDDPGEYMYIYVWDHPSTTGIPRSICWNSYATMKFYIQLHNIILLNNFRLTEPTYALQTVKPVHVYDPQPIVETDQSYTQNDFIGENLTAIYQTAAKETALYHRQEKVLEYAKNAASQQDGEVPGELNLHLFSGQKNEVFPVYNTKLFEKSKTQLPDGFDVKKLEIQTLTIQAREMLVIYSRQLTATFSIPSEDIIGIDRGRVNTNTDSQIAQASIKANITNRQQWISRALVNLYIRIYKTSHGSDAIFPVFMFENSRLTCESAINYYSFGIINRETLLDILKSEIMLDDDNFEQHEIFMQTKLRKEYLEFIFNMIIKEDTDLTNTTSGTQRQKQENTTLDLTEDSNVNF